MKNPQNNYQVDYVAIDIAKATLQIQDDHRAFAVENGPKGFLELLAHLSTLAHPLVVFEASGGYERDLMAALHLANVPLNLVNPARVRAFALSEGVRAKTDPIDTKMILAFAKSKSLTPIPPTPEKILQLAALLDRRDHLVAEQAREKNRLQNSEAFILRFIKRMLKILTTQIASVEKAIEKLLRENSALNARFDILQSVQGVGKVTAWALLAYLPEMETLSRNKLVALAGLAPFNADSGTSCAKRSIIAGRAKARKCLYMAAHTAATHNPVISSYVAGLLQRGKPYKCAIVAAMRKLLLHLQSLLKKAKLATC